MEIELEKLRIGELEPLSIEKLPNYEDILNKCQKVLKTTHTQPARLSVLEQAFYAALHTRNTSTAEKLLAEISQTTSKFMPNSTRTSLLSSCLAASKGQDPEYEALLQQDETNLLVRKRIIGHMAKTAPLNKVLGALIEHLDTFATDREAWSYLASLYAQHSYFSHALFCIEELMLQCPFDTVIITRYAELLYISENFPLAIKYYSYVIELMGDVGENVKPWRGIWLSCKSLEERKDYKEMDKAIVLELAEVAKEEILKICKDDITIAGLSK